MTGAVRSAVLEKERGIKYNRQEAREYLARIRNQPPNARSALYSVLRAIRAEVEVKEAERTEARQDRIEFVWSGKKDLVEEAALDARHQALSGEIQGLLRAAVIVSKAIDELGAAPRDGSQVSGLDAGEDLLDGDTPTSG